MELDAANNNGGIRVEAAEGDNTSLLDVMKSYVGDATTVTHQLVFTSKLGDTFLVTDDDEVEAAKQQFAKEHEEFFQSLNGGTSNPLLKDKVTGILLIYPQYCLQCVECPSEVLPKVIQFVMEHEARKLTNSSKILYSCDVNEPSFALYESKLLNIQGSTTEFKTNESTEKLVADCLGNVLGLSQHLASKRSVHSENSRLKRMDTLQDDVPDLVPPQGLLEYLTKQSQLESLKSYTNRLTQYLHIVLDYDVQWPIPERLYPYD
eukprot:m.270451 g.270451  ORF g.270451 m.270451 type:complete len:263 (-) comp90306_c0_seq1:23-811(-)